MTEHYITLYNGGGAGPTEVIGPVLDEIIEKNNLVCILRLLKTRKAIVAHDLLSNHNFRLVKGTNAFGDDFFMLYSSVNIEYYVEIEERKSEIKPSIEKILTVYEELGYKLRFIVVEIHRGKSFAVHVDAPKTTSSLISVNMALKEAQQLLSSGNTIGAVDRVHTALHGFMKEICNDFDPHANVEGSSITELFKLIKAKHQNFINMDPEATKIIKALSTVIDTCNFIRNNKSIAHPNENIIQDPEAMLAINSCRAIYNYIESKR